MTELQSPWKKKREKKKTNIRQLKKKSTENI